MIVNSRKELESRVALNGPEFQDVLSKQMAKEEKRHEQHVKEFQEKMNVLNQQYMELENEFRLALTIEAKRFKEVRLRVSCKPNSLLPWATCMLSCGVD